MRTVFIGHFFWCWRSELHTVPRGLRLERGVGNVQAVIVPSPSQFF